MLNNDGISGAAYLRYFFVYYLYLIFIRVFSIVKRTWEYITVRNEREAAIVLTKAAKEIKDVRYGKCGG